MSENHALQPHQLRVCAEREELAERLGKLQAFFQSETWQSVPDSEQRRLRHQSAAMALYLYILDERIAAFTPTVTA